MPFDPSNQLEGKVAVITGGARGIGGATARRFAAEGARVVLLDTDEAAVRATAEELEVLWVAGDAAKLADAKRAVDLATESFGGLDVLIACAGADVAAGSLGELDPADWELGLRVNLDTSVAATRAALPALLKRQGSIVIISSAGAIAGSAGTVSYQTAKAALLGLVRSLAVDYGPQGLRVNGVCPGWVTTRMTTELMERMSAAEGKTEAELLARATAIVPLRRAADPSEIASVCLFLASDEASFITGSVLVADGGTTAVNSGTAAFG
jgi:meso-butanediol dehydrogenase / (S,S)-butanediol dehydrogenase / diacetyl reductase